MDPPGSATGSTNAETGAVAGERPLGDRAIEVRGDVTVPASGTAIVVAYRTSKLRTVELVMSTTP